MKQTSSHSTHKGVAADVRGAAIVAEGRELYPSQNAASHGGHNHATTGAHRLRERIERARSANLSN